MEAQARTGSGKIIVTDEEVELKKRGYTLCKLLGAGCFGTVTSAFADNENNMGVAIKMIDLHRTEDHMKEIFVPRELDILESLCHKNLVQVFEVFRHEEKVSPKVNYYPKVMIFKNKSLPLIKSALYSNNAKCLV